MIEDIRKATRSWLAMIVIGLLVVSFALWGVNDIFLPDPNPAIITVGNAEVTADGFARELDLAFRQNRNQYGSEYTMAVALDFGLTDQVVDQIVTRIVLANLAADIGVRTSDNELARQIAGNPTFAGATGTFDRNTYREYLYQLRLTDTQFEELMRTDMERTQLLASLGGGANVPRSMADMYYAYAYEQRALEYFVLRPAAIDTPSDPGNDVLQVYFDANAPRYQAPEYRTVTVLHMSPDEIAESVFVPEEDIRTMYEVRRASLSEPERRTIRQLTFSTRAEADAAYAAILAGAPFDFAGGTLIELNEVTTMEVIDTAVSEAAFSLTAPGLTSVIEGSLAVSIVSVDNITPGTEVAFEEVRDEIRDDLAIRIASEELYALSRTVQDQYAGGLDLENIGGGLNLPVFTIDAVDINGQSSDGARLESLLSIDGLLDNAFNLGEGGQSQLEETLDGSFYIVRVDSITPDRLFEFAEIRDELLADWRNEELSRLLTDMAEAAAARINRGDDFATVAAELGRQVRTPDAALRRSETSEIFSRSALQRLFSVPLNDAIAADVRLGQGSIVARATSVTAAEPNDENITQIQLQLAENFQGEVLQAIIDEARAAANVQINQSALTDLINQIPR